MINSSGQAFTIFKLLIGTVIALVVLTIIISIISYIDTFRFEISKERIVEQFGAALNSPNGATVEVKDLLLKSGYVFSTAELARKRQIDKECITELNVQDSGSFKQNYSAGTVSMRFDSTVTIYFKCEKTETEECDVSCSIGFNKKLD